MTKPPADDLGALRRTGATVEVVFVRRYARPLEKVWAAITLPERLSSWFASSVTIDRLEVGGVIELDFREENYRSLGRIVLWEPMKTFAWEWSELDGSNTSLVRWDLEPDGDGCRLTLTHSGLAPSDAKDVGPGWHTHLQAIEDAADGVATPWNRVKERERLAKPLYADWASLA
ncbi:MAG: SRPBCC family protein [Phenylobacterium sp.]|uniref:SRPBCC family protein n=1 Tax=Phenylobacterium sp. TaxID=1871053 RepID=UPI001A410461|nr:SRPBCC family protein [Phenylobacterium sp.]MBL8770116.1 SRPBCC family protein [Phenylobacterium sp.]